MLLDKIKSPKDLKKLKIKQLNQLALEIRKFLLENVSKTGGHLASNLGVVELTIALHRYLDCPFDKLIFDVGHQAYVHKILTGRRKKFKNLRKKDGISGFPKIDESKFDAFGTGHSSTSISAAMGLREALKNQKSKHKPPKVFALIGDGALTSGLALEALNQIGYLKSEVTIILNDNRMSIAENVGALARYTKRIEQTETYKKVKKQINYVIKNYKNKLSTFNEAEFSEIIKHLSQEKDKLKKSLTLNGDLKKLGILKKTLKKVGSPGLLFEKLGINYIGPIDGHSPNRLLKSLKKAEKLNGPVLIHVKTKKGFGYKLAEKNADKFHGVSPFKIENGQAIKCDQKETFSKAFGKHLTKKAKKDKKIVAISAAMPSGTGLNQFANLYPNRFYDVGICEAHAVTFAAGLAKEGLKPIVAIYSTFLQRAYDQIIHDVCLQKLPVTFAIDRAGLVGSDGPTHHGVFDLSYLLHIPKLTVLAPKDGSELKSMLDFALKFKGPIAIRYPRGCASFGSSKSKKSTSIKKHQAEIIEKGEKSLIISIGNCLNQAFKLKEKDKNFKKATIVNARFLKPIDPKIFNLIKKNKNTAVIEDNAKIGGFGAYLLTELSQKKIPTNLKLIGIEDRFVEQGEMEELRDRYIV
jgi:1-deoxy-D-xylulose-5-phosphate synthase